ncbi:hypothetical protein KEM60_03139 [Austwickia sp. TVS 96-490-7B]|uniref:hypothetical protein n=1 Tax=Austwickia sp. TVS 96-490-7B TaxID=2830843 RepID=UPI001C598B15|nr:hypothetical protein [Austwickia sp. TVS 96-490-7B]MBW3086910.1 hypothetical protein [Austwickia sp. TVS 96-490-7B]
MGRAARAGLATLTVVVGCLGGCAEAPAPSSPDHGTVTWAAPPPGLFADERTVSSEIGRVLALASTGRVLAFHATRSEGQRLGRGHAVLIDKSGHRDLPEDLAGPPRQAVSATSAGGRFVWRETSSTRMDDEDWRIMASDDNVSPLMIGDSQSSAKAGLLSPVLPDSDASLATDGTSAYWTAGTPAAPGTRPGPSRLFAAPVDGNTAPRVLARSVFSPVWDGSRLLAVDADPALDRHEVHLTSIDRATGARHPIPGPRLRDRESLSSFCAGPEMVAFGLAGPDPGRGRLIVRRNGQDLDVPLAGGNAHVVCGTGFVAWGNGSGQGDPGQYLLDLRRKPMVYRLGEVPGLSVVRAAGSFLAWTLPAPRGTVNPSRIARLT